MSKSLTKYFLLCLLGIFCQVSVSDSRIQRDIVTSISQDSNYVATIRSSSCKGSGVSELSLFKFDGKESYRRVSSFNINNCLVPRFLVITNNGHTLAVYDTSEKDSEDILLIYSLQGKTVANYSLSDLYSDDQISEMKETASAIHWLCLGILPRSIENNTVELQDSIDGLFRFDTKSGSYEYIQNPYVHCKP